MLITAALAVTLNRLSILVMSKGNYSDAHAFAYSYDVLTYRQNGRDDRPRYDDRGLVGNVSIRTHACRGASSWNEKHEGRIPGK